MRTPLQTLRDRWVEERGFTLIELLVVITVLGVAITLVTSILLSSQRLQSRTIRRAQIQAGCRQTVDLMSTELREAGADPRNPPIGVVGIVAGQTNMIHVRADLNGDGAIATLEPSEDVTYTFNAAQGTITRDPGTGAVVLLSNVTNMALTYFDAADALVAPLPLSAPDAARVRSIGLTIASLDRDSRPYTLSTRITLRNR